MAELEARNKALVLEYMEAFRTFDPERYFPYLTDNPTYYAGMNMRQGREAFKANTDAGRILYPHPEAATTCASQPRSSTSQLCRYRPAMAQPSADSDSPLPDSVVMRPLGRTTRPAWQ